MSVGEAIELDGPAKRRLFREAIRLVVGDQLGSINMLQRRLGIDIHLADEILTGLEEQDLVGHDRLGASRPVLAKADQVDELLDQFPELPIANPAHTLEVATAEIEGGDKVIVEGGPVVLCWLGEDGEQCATPGHTIDSVRFRAAMAEQTGAQPDDYDDTISRVWWTLHDHREGCQDDTPFEPCNCSDLAIWWVQQAAEGDAGAVAVSWWQD